LPRLPRLNPPSVAQHIIQRGNNRQICFSCEEDFSNYLWPRPLTGAPDLEELSVHPLFQKIRYC
jgi:hypothetical protein